MRENNFQIWFIIMILGLFPYSKIGIRTNYTKNLIKIGARNEVEKTFKKN